MKELEYIDASTAHDIADDFNENHFVEVMNPLFSKIKAVAKRGEYIVTLFDTSLDDVYQKELKKRGYNVKVQKYGPNEYKTVITWGEIEVKKILTRLKLILKSM